MGKKVISTTFRFLCVLALPAALVLLFSLLAPGFGISSLPLVLKQAMIPTLMGIGMAFGQVAGIFDLSVGSRVVLAATVGGLLGNMFGLPGLIAGSLLGGIVPAVVMGQLYNALRLPSLVLSLGFVMILEIITCFAMNNTGQMAVSPDIAILGKSPWNFILVAICGVIFYILFYHTRFSYNVRVVGNNELLAKNMGINIRRTYFLCFFVGGIFIGIVGILQLCYANSVSASVQMGSMALVFKPMMGVMIGMELMSLLDNFVIDILVGEICISIIFNGLIALGFSATMQDVALGVFMLIVMAGSANRDKLSAGKRISRSQNLAGRAAQLTK
jgi:ribose transport system permease protein